MADDTRYVLTRCLKTKLYDEETEVVAELNITTEDVRNLFGLGPDDPSQDLYEIDPKDDEKITYLLLPENQCLDCKKYIYFIETQSDDPFADLEW